MLVLARRTRLVTVLFLVALMGTASAQEPRLGAAVAPGAVVELPEVETVGGTVTRAGVPTVVAFLQVRDCSLCEGVGHVLARFMSDYPNLQVVAVENQNRRSVVERWHAELGVPIVPTAEKAFANAFDTNLTAVYLLDEDGTVRDKVRPVRRAQWLALDRQLARANAGDWGAVDASSVALPPVGEVARGTPSVPVGGGSPVLVLHATPSCDWCRQLLADGLAGAVNEVAGRYPGLRVYLLEPSQESLAAGFYGTSSFDFGPRETFAEFAERFGEEAAGDEIMTYLRTGEVARELPGPVWPDDGWAPGVTVVRYEVGGPDDPVVAWGYGDDAVGMLTFDAEGRYLGPVPFFSGNTPSAFIRTASRLLGE